MIEILVRPAFFIEMQRTDNNQPSQFCTDASYHKILELSNFRWNCCIISIAPKTFHFVFWSSGQIVSYLSFCRWILHPFLVRWGWKKNKNTTWKSDSLWRLYCMMIITSKTLHCIWNYMQWQKKIWIYTEMEM